MDFLLIKYSILLYNSLPLNKTKELTKLLNERDKFELFIFFLYHNIFIPFDKIVLTNYYEWKNIEQYIFKHKFYNEVYNKIKDYVAKLSDDEISEIVIKIENLIEKYNKIKNVRKIGLPKEFSFLQKKSNFIRIKFFPNDILINRIVYHFIYNHLSLSDNEKLFLMKYINQINNDIDFSLVKSDSIRIYLAWLFIAKKIRFKIKNVDIVAGISIIENISNIDKGNIRSFWAYMGRVDYNTMSRFYKKNRKLMDKIVIKYNFDDYYVFFKKLPGIVAIRRNYNLNI